jgi:hypothetical protein
VGKATIGLGLVIGCLGPPAAQWGGALPAGQREQALAALPQDAQRTLLPLSEIFYARITSRRFNSRATFEDPSVRQFFPSLSAYSDYYAALADALETAHIEYSRPYRVDLLGLERLEDGSLRLDLRFVGENDLPLRWWRATLQRSDQWQWRDGRWWVVPGKV